MNWRFRSAGYVIVFVVGVSVGMVLANRLAGEQYALRGVEARSSENAAKLAAAAGPQTRLEFSGNGPAASDEFDLVEGPARISVEYDGHNWLWVELAEVGRSGEPIIGGLAFAGSNVGPGDQPVTAWALVPPVHHRSRAARHLIAMPPPPHGERSETVAVATLDSRWKIDPRIGPTRGGALPPVPIN